jgi:hypothetical protein
MIAHTAWTDSRQYSPLEPQKRLDCCQGAATTAERVVARLEVGTDGALRLDVEVDMPLFVALADDERFVGTAALHVLTVQAGDLSAPHA